MKINKSNKKNYDGLHKKSACKKINYERSILGQHNAK